jgi:hypothetical protein
MTQGVGTACWLSPEVINHAHYTKKSDVYAYGIVLWELWTRKEVHATLSAIQIIAKVSNNNLRPAVTLDCIWKEIMVKCWTTNPIERPEFSIIMEFFKQYFNLYFNNSRNNNNNNVRSCQNYNNINNISTSHFIDKAPYGRGRGAVEVVDTTTTNNNNTNNNTNNNINNNYYTNNTEESRHRFSKYYNDIEGGYDTT